MQRRCFLVRRPELGETAAQARSAEHLRAQGSLDQCSALPLAPWLAPRAQAEPAQPRSSTCWPSPPGLRFPPPPPTILKPSNTQFPRFAEASERRRLLPGSRASKRVPARHWQTNARRRLRPWPRPLRAGRGSACYAAGGGVVAFLLAGSALRRGVTLPSPEHLTGLLLRPQSHEFVVRPSSSGV